MSALPITTAGPEHAAELAAFFAEQTVGSASFAYRIDRSPDFFRYCRLQGHDHRILIAESTRIWGLLSVLFDRVHLGGQPREIAYTGDLRLDPSVRGQGLGDRFMREGIRTCRHVLGPEAPIVTAVMADNPAGLKMNANLERDGTATMRPIAEVELFFLFPWIRPARSSSVRIRPARLDDLPRMHDLWRQVASKRELSRSFTRAEWTDWVLNSPGLGIEAYALAEDAAGQLLGFLAAWDMSPVRRFMLASETASQRWIRRAWNAGRRLLGASRTGSSGSGLPRFPKAGEVLPFLAATNLCVADERAFLPLIHAGLGRARQQGALFLGIALDRRDPLIRQMRGLPASRSKLLLLGNEALPPDAPDRQTVYHVEIAMG